MVELSSLVALLFLFSQVTTYVTLFSLSLEYHRWKISCSSVPLFFISNHVSSVQELLKLLFNIGVWKFHLDVFRSLCASLIWHQIQWTISVCKLKCFIILGKFSSIYFVVVVIQLLFLLYVFLFLILDLVLLTCSDSWVCLPSLLPLLLTYILLLGFTLLY